MLIRAILLSAMIPGLGDVMLGRPVRGMLLALGFTACVSMALLRALFVQPVLNDMGFICVAAAALGIWLFGLSGLIRIALRPLIKLTRPDLDDFFRVGIHHYLNGRLTHAERAFKRMLWIDPADADAHLRLGLVYKAQGKAKRARASFKRCSAFDPEGKWRAEVARELRSLPS